MFNGAFNCRGSSTECIWHYKGNRMDEVLIFVREDEKGTNFLSPIIVFHVDFLISLLVGVWRDQNPENYAVKKGTASDRIEKHLQGTNHSSLVEEGKEKPHPIFSTIPNHATLIRGLHSESERAIQTSNDLDRRRWVPLKTIRYH